jgi:nucleotide-binding universal stress UspA family protein
MTGKILVAVDSTDASTQALSYVVKLLENSKGVQFRLFHVLPPIPPEYREHGGSEDPDEELTLGKKLMQAQNDWVDKAKSRAQPVIDNAKTMFLEAGIPAEMVSTEFSTCAHPAELVDDILEAAKAWKCETIVVGRQCCSKFAELFHHHVGEELLQKGKGFAIWIVE